MLRDFVHTKLSPEELCDLLTMAGFEVEGTEEIEGDTVLEIKVCSNRGDGLSALGLAREILAKEPKSQPTTLYTNAVEGFIRGDEDDSSQLSVTLAVETELCDCFGFRGFQGIKNGSSPDWIQQRLRQAGMRPISLLVDLTNYVMLEVGQPLHAYDLTKLRQRHIGVRSARRGELLKTLDGTERELQPNHMVIVDGEGPIGLAGIMGGENTEVDSTTSEVLLEAAHFNHQSIRSTRKQVGISTEASYRFERSVDPNLVTVALNRVAELVELSGQKEAILTGITKSFSSDKQPVARSISLNLNRARMLLGFEFETTEAIRALEKLGFQVSEKEGYHEVKVPSWRFDVELEEDLIEDIGRVLGYERIPEQMPDGVATVGGLFGQYKWHDGVIKKALMSGMDQAMTHSLVGESPLFDPHHNSVRVQNPASPETTFVRNSVLPGLAASVLRNAPSGKPFFELGPIFRKSADGYESLKSFGFLGFGPVEPPDRKQDSPKPIDFFWAKSILESIFGELQFSAGKDPRFHSHRQAKVSGTVSGSLGQIHPKIADKMGLPIGTIMAEVDLVYGDWVERRVEYHPISRTPSIRRDIAISISKSVLFSDIEQVVRRAGGELLESLWLFDVYEGPGIDAGSHSLALAMTFRKHGATFTDDEANQVRDLIVAELGRLGAKQR